MDDATEPDRLPPAGIRPGFTAAFLTLLALAAPPLLADDAPLRWERAPAATFDSQTGEWRIDFSLNARTDVEVSVVDVQTERTIRHLAAGLLGPAPPPPLAANTAAQQIVWNGKDDFNRPIAADVRAAVRVRAGMSAKLEQIVGGDPYAFYSEEMGHNDHSPFGINGLEAKSDGSVYVLGHSSNLGPPAVRCYAANGDYRRTVFPPPAGLPIDRMTGWGLRLRPDGGYAPIFTRLTDPSLTTTLIDGDTGGMARLFPGPAVELDRLRFWHTGFRDPTFEQLAIHTDGTIDADPKRRSTGPLVLAPPLPLGPIAPESHVRRSLLGPIFTAWAPDGRHFYLSGAYEAVVRYGSVLEVPGEGFWRGGQVWKVDARTRRAAPFFALDAAEVAAADKHRKTALGGAHSYTALHGVATDDADRLFVCDRLNRRLLVLDAQARILKQLTVEHPDAVTISRRTGALYVTTRSGEWGSAAPMTLLKFDDWRTAERPSQIEPLASAGYAGAHRCSHLAVADTPQNSFLWVAHTELPVRVYREEPTGLALVKDFYRVENAQRCLGFDRIAVDRHADVVYVLDDHSSVWKIGDWKRPRFERLPIATASIAIDAENRHLYAHLGGGHSKRGIARFHLDSACSPAPYDAAGGHEVTPRIYSEWCFTGNGDLGFDVAPDGALAALDQHGDLLYFQGDSTKLPWTAVKPAKPGVKAGGVKFDLAGALYVGYVDQPPTRIPPGWETDPLAANLGRIHKFVPAGSTPDGPRFSATPVRPTRTYDVPYGAFDVDCIVRSPRFDVDGFGRICYPTNIAQSVAVIDNEGNELLRFGEYANRDSTGGLADDRVPVRGIPLGFPNSVAATDDHLYVGDMVNQRLLRIRKQFQLDRVVPLAR